MALTLTKLGKYGNQTFVTGVILVLAGLYLTRTGYDGWMVELVDEMFGAGILVTLVGVWAVFGKGGKR